MDGVPYFLNGFVKPDNERVEYWMSQQKASGYSESVFWVSLNDAWLVYRDKINNQIAKNKAMGIMGATNGQIPLTIETRLAIVGSIFEDDLAALRGHLVTLAINWNLAITYYDYKPLNIAQSENGNLEKLIKYLRSLNNLEFENDLIAQKAENVNSFLNYHFNYFKNKSGNVDEWVNHTRDLVKGETNPVNRQLAIQWLWATERQIQKAKQRSLEDITNEMWAAFSAIHVPAYNNDFKHFYASHAPKIDKLTDELRSALDREDCKLNNATFQSSVEHIKKVIEHKLSGVKSAEVLVEMNVEGAVKEFESAVFYEISSKLKNIFAIVSNYDINSTSGRPDLINVPLFSTTWQPQEVENPGRDVSNNPKNENTPNAPFESMFNNPEHAEVCLSILRELERPVIDADNNYIGKNKGIFPLWVKILKNHKPQLIKHFSDIIYKDYLNEKIKGLTLTEDASEFRKEYKMLTKQNIELDIKALLSEFSQMGKFGK